MITMTQQEMQALFDRYEARFGGTEEIVIPQIEDDERFLRLLEVALESGVPVTKGQIDAVIPDVAWEL